MKKYIGAKMIDAEPKLKGIFLDSKGEHTDVHGQEYYEEGYRVVYPDGYVSWSPKDVFEEAYRETSGGMTFGLAVEAMKKGLKAARSGWNGAEMFAYYVPGGKYKAQTDLIKGRFPDDLVPYRPYLALKTAQNDVATWSPSTSDALADDWFILE